MGHTCGTTHAGDSNRRAFLQASVNDGFVDAVARTHVELTLADLRRRSPVLAALEARGVLKIAGAMYDITTAQVAFFA